MPNSNFFIFLSSYGRKRLSFLVMVFILTSCSHGIFSIPPAAFTYYENSLGTGRAISIENTGIIVDTNADIGITIGHSNKTYFFEGHNSHKFSKNNFKIIPGNNAGKISTDLSLYRLREKKVTLPNWRIEKPTAYSVASEGVALNAGMYRVGLTLGLNRYARLIIPYEFDGIMFINTETDSAKNSVFSIESTP